MNNVCNKRLTIYKESVVSSIGKTLGMKEIHIGYDYFDRRFIIKGDNEQFATNLLTPTIQDRLLSLYSHHVRLVLDHGDLKVKVPEKLKKEEDCDLLIDTALLIVDRLDELQ